MLGQASELYYAWTDLALSSFLTGSDHRERQTEYCHCLWSKVYLMNFLPTFETPHNLGLNIPLHKQQKPNQKETVINTFK